MTDCNIYDVIIPSSERDINFLPYVIKYIRKNLLNARNIYIITSEKNFKNIQKNDEKYNVFLLNEDLLIDGLNFENVKKCLIKNGINPKMTGWYFQQFLKYAFAFTQYCENFYLSWDSDTLPLSHISFFSHDHPVFTLKKEYHKPYFVSIKKLLGLEKQNKESFIAEHMLFSKVIVHELIKEIKIRNSQSNWWNACLDTIQYEGPGNYFSEFETYGTFVTAKYPNLYRYQHLNTLRAAGMIRGRHINDKMLNRLAIDVDIASFELQDEKFPFNGDLIKYKTKKLLRRFF